MNVSGACTFAAVPVVGLLSGLTNTAVIVFGAVFVVLAVICCFLIVRTGTAPKVEWGRFKLGFERLPREGDHPIPPARLSESEAD